MLLLMLGGFNYLPAQVPVRLQFDVLISDPNDGLDGLLEFPTANIQPETRARVEGNITVGDGGDAYYYWDGTEWVLRDAYSDIIYQRSTDGSGGTLTFTPTGGDYEILTSTDLETWTPVTPTATVTNADGTVTETVASTGSVGYYRVVGSASSDPDEEENNIDLSGEIENLREGGSSDLVFAYWNSDDYSEGQISDRLRGIRLNSSVTAAEDNYAFRFYSSTLDLTPFSVPAGNDFSIQFRTNFGTSPPTIRWQGQFLVMTGANSPGLYFHDIGGNGRRFEFVDPSGGATVIEIPPSVTITTSSYNTYFFRKEGAEYIFEIDQVEAARFPAPDVAHSFIRYQSGGTAHRLDNLFLEENGTDLAIFNFNQTGIATLLEEVSNTQFANAGYDEVRRIYLSSDQEYDRGVVTVDENYIFSQLDPSLFYNTNSNPEILTLSGLNESYNNQVIVRYEDDENWEILVLEDDAHFNELRAQLLNITRVPIWVFTGQSNSVGLRGTYLGQPVENENLPIPILVSRYAGSTGYPINENPSFYPTFNAMYNSNFGFGSGLKVARSLYGSSYRSEFPAEKRFAVVQAGAGGQRARFWDPQGERVHYDNLTYAVDDMITIMNAQVPDTEFYLHAIKINQGEDEVATGANWITSWKNFVDEIRQDYGDQVNFYVEMLNTDGLMTFPNRDIDDVIRVRNQQESLLEGSGSEHERERVYGVNSNDIHAGSDDSGVRDTLTRNNDNHYSDPLGYNRLGELSYEVIKEAEGF